MEKQGKLTQWLQERCKKEHLSLRQTALRAGLSHSTVQHIVNLGYCPSPETIRKLARAFDGDGHRGLALEDKLLVLAGHRTPRPERQEPNQPLISLLSPQHQHIVEVLVRELAKVEGIEAPKAGRNERAKSHEKTTVSERAIPVEKSGIKERASPKEVTGYPRRASLTKVTERPRRARASEVIERGRRAGGCQDRQPLGESKRIKYEATP